jgi:ATP-dependent DNA helicase DinG
MQEKPRLVLPEAPAVVAGAGRAAVLTTEGELLSVPVARAAALLGGVPPLLIHAPATFRRLGMRQGPAFDLLELFAFARPATGAAPTARGLALALDLDPPGADPQDAVALLPAIATALLRRLAQGRDLPLNRDAASLAARLGAAGWGWAESVLAALGQPAARPSTAGMLVWDRLPNWESAAPPPPPANHPVTPADARSRLAAMLGPEAEQRPGQSDYAAAAAAAFDPRPSRGDPRLVLAEAGTGTGKTLGYLAPASLWAERNKGAVWVSTYTRHLQRQIQAEVARLIPDPAERRRRIVVRKGRENYLCLLRLDEAAASPAASPAGAIPLGLIARWALATDDGDMQGGDLPGWLVELYPSLPRLADRRGECLHGGCRHWRRCFVEHTIRRARGADLVIANHALVMTQAALGGLDDGGVPTRYVFDEGHLLFEAADNAFAAVLSGAETAELRRWLLGSETTRRGPRGLRARLAELTADRPDLSTPLDAALLAARALATFDWPARLGAAAPELGGLDAGQPNPTEAFLHALRAHILATLPGAEPPGPGLHECTIVPVSDAIPPAAERLARALNRIAEPLATLRARLDTMLETDADALSEEQRGTIEGMVRSIRRRALNPLAAWRAMLTPLADPVTAAAVDETHVLLARLDRRAAGDHDVALARHWLDPTIPFTVSLAQPAHGLLVTSATLRDAGTGDPEAAWAAAEARIGAPHLPSPALRAALPSPFDYAAQTRAYVVTDVGQDLAALAGAYRALFLASGGGGLGLFTAISRLRAVHARIAPALEEAGIPLLAQHVDAMDNATLVDIFRTEEASCLLGTDAMRDGVDVPGRALRLVVFERVPWPRPDILHRARRTHLSGGDPKGYDERAARLRLRQAFGRLIRRATDRGVFVLLERQTPTRLLSAFPEGVAVRRVGLAEAVQETAAFLKPYAHAP